MRQAKGQALYSQSCQIGNARLAGFPSVFLPSLKNTKLRGLVLVGHCVSQRLAGVLGYLNRILSLWAENATDKLSACLFAKP